MRPMQTSQIIKNLSRAHFLYRRALPGTADKDTQRTRIAIYQRLFHTSTGCWPDMSLINASIRRYETEFWLNYIRQKAIESSRATRPITNSGPGGPNCQAKSADTCRCKGTTREFKTPHTKKNYCAVDRTASPYKQTAQLTNAIIKAAKDGARLEAVLYRPEFGELILDCGNPSPTHKSRMDAKGHHGHGVQHALEARHNITPHEIAKTLIFGEVSQDSEDKSRLLVRLDTSHVILEKEIRQGSGRVSATKAKLHTAIRKSRQ